MITALSGDAETGNEEAVMVAKRFVRSVARVMVVLTSEKTPSVAKKKLYVSEIVLQLVHFRFLCVTRPFVCLFVLY